MTKQEFKSDLGKIILCAIKLKGYTRAYAINQLVDRLVDKLEFKEDKND
jgi:hypothetical protein